MSMLKVTKSYDEFKRWDNFEQRKLLNDHIPERNRRKQEIEDKCGDIHCFRNGTGFIAERDNVKQCVHCGFRTHNKHIIERGLKQSIPERVAEYRAFITWNSEQARILLEDQIVERKRRLVIIQNECEAETGHCFEIGYNHKKKRKQLICMHCTFKKDIPRSMTRQEKLANFKAQIAEKQSC